MRLKKDNARVPATRALADALVATAKRGDTPQCLTQ
jgi:hypothetical protein